MKRSKLERRTPLTTRRSAMKPGALERKTRLQRAVLALKRSGGLKRSKMPTAVPTPVSEAEWAARRAWTLRVMKPGARCENPACPYRGVQGVSPGRLEGHHALRRQTIERLAKAAGLDPVVIAWDTRWQIRLDPFCHANHTSRARRLPASVLTPEAIEAARSLDRALEAAGRPAAAMLGLLGEYSVAGLPPLPPDGSGARG